MWMLRILCLFFSVAMMTDDIAFEAPLNEWKLPKSLKEFSGMTILPNGQIAMVQDEKGVIYFFDPDTGEVVDELKFKKKGDFEGITFLSGHFYVLQSDGHLFEVNATSKQERSYRLPFDADNDLEGITSDGRYLYVCPKENSGLYGAEANNKIIWQLDPRDFFLPPKAVISLSKSAYLKNTNKDRWKSIGFSGIAVHPTSGMFYVLSHRSHEVMVFSPDGEITTVWSYPKKLLPQAEAITFDHQGYLLIGSEAGKKKHGRLYRFSIKKR